MNCGVGCRRGSDPRCCGSGGYSSDSTPSLGASKCRGSHPRNSKKTKKKKKRMNSSLNEGVLIVAQRKRIQLASIRMWVRSLASFSGLRVQRFPELLCRSQMQLRSSVAMVVVLAGHCSSSWTLAWELPYATGMVLKKRWGEIPRKME